MEMEMDELDLSQLSIDCVEDNISQPPTECVENYMTFDMLNLSQLSVDDVQTTVGNRSSEFSMDDDVTPVLDISQLSIDCIEEHDHCENQEHPIAFSTPKKSKQIVDIYEFQGSDSEEVLAPISSPALQLEEDESSLDGSCDISSDMSHLPSDQEQFGEYIVNPDVSARPLDKRKSDKVVKPVNKKYWSKISKSSMKKAMHSRCKCRRSCMKKMSQSVMKSARRCYWSKTPHERRKWLNEQFKHSKDSRFKIENGPEVCQVGFYMCMGIHRATFFQRKRAALMGSLATSSKFRNRQISQASMLCIIWLEEYISSRGDHMPHKDEIRLPHGYSKKDIYNEYLHDKAELFDPTVGQAEFYNLWTRFFWHVKVKKASIIYF